MLDCKLNFTAYVKEQAKKACAKTSALKRIRNCSDLQHLSQLISDCQSCLAMTEFQILFFLQYLKHSKILPKVRLSFPQKNRKTSALFDVSSQNSAAISNYSITLLECPCTRYFKCPQQNQHDLLHWMLLQQSLKWTSLELILCNCFNSVFQLHQRLTHKPFLYH